MNLLHRPSPIAITLHSIVFLTAVCSLRAHHLTAIHTPPGLVRRQAPSSLENSLLNPLSSNPSNSNPATISPTGANRAVSSNPTPSDPASNSSSTPPNSTSSSSKESSILPLLGSSLGVPASNPLTNSSTPANSSLTSPTPTTPLTSVATPSANKTSSANASVTPTPSPLPTSSSDQTSSNRPTPSNPTSTNRPETHAPQDKSTFGSTTVKFLAIAGGVAAGLFLLWTVIRKWKFRPSKRFANKLEDYDADIFEPRAPSFSEKRPSGYPSYPAEKIPTTGPDSSTHYPSHVPDRVHTPHNIPRQNLFSQGSPPYAVHRLSNNSVTKPLPIFENNPYRLSLGLGSEISHSYPPSDHPHPSRP